MLDVLGLKEQTTSITCNIQGLLWKKSPILKRHPVFSFILDIPWSYIVGVSKTSNIILNDICWERFSHKWDVKMRMIVPDNLFWLEKVILLLAKKNLKIWTLTNKSVSSNALLPASVSPRPSVYFKTAMVLFLGPGSCSSDSSSVPPLNWTILLSVSSWLWEFSISKTPSASYI